MWRYLDTWGDFSTSAAQHWGEVSTHLSNIWSQHWEDLGRLQQISITALRRSQHKPVQYLKSALGGLGENSADQHHSIEEKSAHTCPIFEVSTGRTWGERQQISITALRRSQHTPVQYSKSVLGGLGETSADQHHSIEEKTAHTLGERWTCQLVQNSSRIGGLHQFHSNGFSLGGENLVLGLIPTSAFGKLSLPSSFHPHHGSPWWRGILANAHDRDQVTLTTSQTP